VAKFEVFFFNGRNYPPEKKQQLLNADPQMYSINAAFTDENSAFNELC